MHSSWSMYFSKASLIPCISSSDMWKSNLKGFNFLSRSSESSLHSSLILNLMFSYLANLDLVVDGDALNVETVLAFLKLPSEGNVRLTVDCRAHGPPRKFACCICFLSSLAPSFDFMRLSIAGAMSRGKGPCSWTILEKVIFFSSLFRGGEVSGFDGSRSKRPCFFELFE